ncbi:acetate--CoA ligase family protein [Rhodohalobacter barkolensis]|uniref:Acyl-CoA synthetase n=1 Tax=Rhodohalobacter barkolensis TaxID=2053187 RepID=A0A2N0VJS2_9BACT|nr:acetate--CoA ligase [Rhodohalobacter barkolensis]PKD44436.1 acyl-CoA synthetase [Rhodohalobacter barkolensis]
MIESFFSPKKVAVIGASRDPHKLGYGVIRNLLKYKFKGEIFPVNKNASEILDIPCYSSVEDLPDGIDLAVVVLPATIVPKIIEQCGAKEIKNAIVVSGGFSETGEEGQELEDKLKEVAEKHGIRIIGPNCIGTIDTHTPVNTTFVVGMPEQGGIGFISQSGAMVAAVIDWARGAGVGFSRIVSLGNQIDVTETEMIDLIGNDRQTEVITAYAEGVSDGAKFLKISREIARKKPFVILKGGQSEKGAEAVSSHTGALSGSKEAYSAAFRKSGVLEARTMEEMFDWARTLAWQPLPKGKRVAVLTNAGGPAILAVDALEKVGLEMAPLTNETKNYLKSRLPKAASAKNPVDVLAGSGPATYTLALEALLTDETVDAVIVIQAPQDWFLPASLAEVVGETAGLHKKPVIASIMGKASVDEALNILHKRRVPNVSFPERAASIIAAMVQRKEWMNSENHQPEEAAKYIPADADTYIKNENWEHLIEAYGIKLPEQTEAENLADALDASNKMGYPVVMKILAKEHTHKSDIGGVKVNLQNSEDVKKAWNEITQAAERSNAEMDGVLIQKMLRGGQEIIIGIKQDEQFGPLVVFGTGGTEVELYKDVETAVAPLSDSEANQLIESTIAGKKLKGWRNLPPADMDAVKQALISMSRIAVNHPEILEMEMNPLFVLEKGEGAFAIDIRGTKSSN